MENVLKAVDTTAGAIVALSRFIIIASGIALTVVTTANVLARYTLQSGGFSFAQELPLLIFPLFILAGIVIAAQAGGHMAVEWLYDQLEGRSRIAAFVIANAISVAAFLVLGYQAVVVAEIAGVEHSPVLQLPNSIGYYALAIGALLVSIVTVSATLRVLRLGWGHRTVIGSGEMPL
ncbi:MULTISPECIES: TRAP transporter small permease [Rhizobium]|jgi:TRAP-type C4-dicarboxylate transport system permease small subunit|uniref:TRAP transporter small permease protein n=1 Tax=Rhizobium anhuiense TaxID=1184720 RepID=A0A3S0Q6P7_9HYPH|nr:MULTISPECIES: TRAP transporter small permease subunit [Rhizobium]KZS55012.1 C4-dicarboxylate ABC transporter permease [Rhizobium anhuiense bv. trifolii]MBB3301688.1 TRAP-type C4-dicarboxylate transport system permease small subunit [Rhizobium sp. BK112]MBB3370842.1 TRAP-type C4-dicarboxylate transport system permease small subunit [Rhizobium sp. BK077]MBB3746803.1 TRAP-type C4-dicarboxylate transport system permease small subunit [Rhizobium sp. BK591]MBB4115470.1 TRAP-type C4-dicarboxylate 